MKIGPELDFAARGDIGDRVTGCQGNFDTVFQLAVSIVVPVQ